MGQNYSQLTAGERNQFYALRKAKIPMTEIANQLNRSRTTLYNELNRNIGGRGYRPKQGKQIRSIKRENSTVMSITQIDISRIAKVLCGHTTAGFRGRHAA